MNAERDRELRARYPDLLEDAANEPRLRFLHHLDRAYRVVSHGRVAVPSTRPQLSLQSQRMGWRRSMLALLTRPSRRLILVALAAVIIASGGTLSLAATGILNLGKPTAATVRDANFPLSGFHRSSLAALRSGGRPELLWIGTAWPGDGPSDVERWPLVKALESFGTFSHMAIGPQYCIDVTSYPRSGPVTAHLCTLPSFDWSRARYRSKYITFVRRDLIDSKAHAHPGMTASEHRLFDRFVRNKPGATLDSLAASIYDPYSSPNAPQRGHFPLIALGGYVETQTQIPLLGDFALGDAVLPTSQETRDGLNLHLHTDVLTFDQVQNALSTGKTPVAPAPRGYPPTPFPQLQSDVNAEANVITALICHADGSKPKGVCKRPVIKSILKHVR